MSYPLSLPSVDQIAPAPRRVRAVLGTRTILDTTSALYVWEWPHYPQYYLPIADVDQSLLVDEGHTERFSRGTARRYGLAADDGPRPGALHVYGEDALAALADHARFRWDALDAWYEEDEEVFVHPRDPYTRVDALRSTREVRVELEGVLLARSAAPVMVFETGLPTRYYLNPTEVDFAHLVPSDTETACPYKGVTSRYWSVRVGGTTQADLAWSYDFPTRQLLPVAGLVCFYNEKVDISLDGVPQPRPVTHLG